MIINGREIHIWNIQVHDLAVSASPLRSCLSESEIARIQSFKNPAVSARFEGIRGSLRMILGAYLQCDPRAVEIKVGPDGKPYLGGGHPSLFFNLSHSNDVVVCAVSHTDLGIDIEKVRQMANVLGVSRRFFSSEEHAALAKIENDNDRNHLFFRLWTAKEAVLKGTGMGIAHGLANTIIRMKNLDQLELLKICGSSEEAGKWRLKEMSVEPGYLCTMAIKSELDHKILQCSMAQLRCHTVPELNASKQSGDVI